MIKIRATTENEALLLSEIQRQAFLPLYDVNGKYFPAKNGN